MTELRIFSLKRVLILNSLGKADNKSCWLFRVGFQSFIIKWISWNKKNENELNPLILYRFILTPNNNKFILILDIYRISIKQVIAAFMNNFSLKRKLICFSIFSKF